MTKDFKNEFKAWLIAEDYSKLSASDYTYRVLKVKDAEGVTWKELVTNLEAIAPAYEAGGEKQSVGNRSHESVKNAIRAFRRFISARALLTETPEIAPQNIVPAVA